jgi:hypothetical protein
LTELVRATRSAPWIARQSNAPRSSPEKTAQSAILGTLGTWPHLTMRFRCQHPTRPELDHSLRRGAPRPPYLEAFP